mgnify:CR=1 FL=1
MLKTRMHKSISITSIYYFSFLLYSFGYWLNDTNISDIGINTTYIYIGTRIICIAFLCIYMFAILSLRNSVKILPVLLIFSISAYVTQSYDYLLLILFIICARKIDIDYLAKIQIATIFCIVLITVPLALLNIIPSRYLMTESGTVRNSLGFYHPNQFAMALLVCCICIFLLDFGKFHISNCLIIIAILAFMYIYTASRTSLIIGLLVLAIYFWSSKFKLKKIFLSELFAVIGLYIFSIFCMFNYSSNNAVLSKINDLLSLRLELMNHYYTIFGDSIFGRNLSDYNQYYRMFKGVVIDNAYARMYIENGMVVSFILLVILIATLFFYLKNKLYNKEIICLLLFLILAFTESSAVYACVNIGFVAISNYFYKRINRGLE